MRKSPDSNEALAPFISRKAEIDAILGRLAAQSAQHFNRAPDNVSWADAGTLASYQKGLREVSEATFQEGEYAA
ncbi:MAG: hypothetical protein QOJ42_5792 [Acidobacteriaceae bacterium]|nr:hypothetical protein [Acidobacteriaceae bacterium]